VSEIKHTPGPWEILDNDDVEGEICWEITSGEFGPGHKSICWVRPVRADGAVDEEQHANALLIAASPDLYTGLKHAVAIIRQFVPEDALGFNSAGDGHAMQSWPLLAEHLHYMDQAIAKAEGKS
jgi:hypothetical protein